MKDGWVELPLVNLATIRPPKKEVLAKLEPSDQVSFVPMDSLGIGTQKLAQHGSRSLDNVYKSYTYFQDKDVLLAKITPCFENGKLGIAQGLFNGVGFGSSEFFVFRAGEKILPEFLYYYLSRAEFREYASKRMTGAVGHKRVPKEFIEQLLVPVPAIGEQRRIVAILDEAFEGLDQAQKNAEANLADGERLLQRSLSKNFENSDQDWVTLALSDLTSKIGSGATPKGGASSYKSKGIPLVRSMNVHDREFRYENLAFLDEEQATRLSNVTLIAGDILLNITGASIARSCILPENLHGSRVNQHVSIIRPNLEKLLPNFLNLLLTSDVMKDHLLEIGQDNGSTRQALTKKQLQSLKICFPTDLRIQVEIVKKCGAISNAISELRKGLLDQQAMLLEARQSLLAKAFTGELT